MLRRLREKTVGDFVPIKEVGQKLPPYPPDHPLGMVVPKGGSSCAKCEYLVKGKLCMEKHFRMWHGSPKLPAPADQYCCDFFEAKEGSA